MSDDKIAEIRARHLRDDRWCYSPSPQMHDDRATLLDEVDRQRAEIEKLRASIQSLAESLRASLDAAIRLRDEARAENEKLRAENEALHEALRRGDGDRFVVERRTTGPDTPVAFIREGKP